MQLADMLGMAQQQAPSVLPSLGQMPGAPMPQLQMAPQMQAAPIAQQQAPIVEKSQPMAPPMPQAPQVQPQGDPTWGSRWQAIKQKLDDPAVMGPLQTFFGVLGAPLGPGENVGARMARASMMMQSHRQMLLENQKNEETAAQDRQMKMEDRALAREEKQLNIKKLGVETTAKEQGMAPALALTLQQLEKTRMEVEQAPEKHASAMADARNMRAYRDRLPQAGGGGGGSAAEKTSLLNSYDAIVKNPYLAWGKARLRIDPNADVSWDTFLGTDSGKKAGAWVDAARGKIPLETRNLAAGQTLGGSSNIIDPTAPLGSPQNPITKRPPSRADQIPQ